ncbi:pyrroloquinoline quinone-dependent dehydrogenase [Parahaliea maris]|uniref:Pyrroloquinoline quinone-dependent dehydrogenase n=1 Tax=Parahaliea maris TaxID=2716870 RepID=A0A5C9A449_9GAMM|nr:pyrroloquinoline quinone-dependent dehydrogenase [Parahaliea maris]TXS95496.1 pyrroloquinoline quinone-dependent dehydrogenase [Parahaliea maris]
MTPRLALALATASLCLAGCRLPDSAPASPTTEAPRPAADWRNYGGTDGAQYSPLMEIAPANVSDLEVAWEHRSGDIADGRGEWGFTSLQVTPLVADGTLYYCTPFGRVFALDAETGREQWSFDPQVRNRHSGLYPVICRGVSLWQDDGPGAGACRTRILYGTRDAELIALDAATGQPCEDFGTAGRVSLKTGIDGARTGEYYPTSPPWVQGDLAIVGAAIPDNERRDVPSGVVRAYDVRSGNLVWAWEPVTEAYRHAHRDTLKQNRYHLGTPNVWAPIAGDPARGLVYVPTGNPSPDVYGGDRQGIDALGSSVVALDAATGTYRWHFQTVHHDVWDYDVASQPTLFQFPGVGDGRPGLAQATKMGHLFLLDRETGAPLYPVEERPVPGDGVPGETLSPTQPFPTHPGPLHLPEHLQAEDMDGFVWFDRAACQRELARYRNDGMFTPPSLKGSVLYPTTTGGINWGGISIDGQRAIALVNQMHLAAVVQLIPRAEYDAAGYQGSYPLEYYPMRGSPYGVKRFPLMSPLGAPCNPRPWGSLAAVDLGSGEVLWRRPLGTTRGLAPWPFWFEAGTPNTGGPLTTASGLTFIGATTDGTFRAFDTRTGEELWKHQLPYTGNATPLSYRARPGGRQFVVIAAGGHGWSEPGDAIVAFALPKTGAP